MLLHVILAGTFALSSAAGAPHSARLSDPRAILDSAIERMGGAAKLEAVKQARFEYLTQWYRMSFDDNLFGAAMSSVETNVDHRDYSANKWRYVRHFVRAGAPFEVIDVVADSTAAFFGNGAKSWAPLSVAYVDERHELFTFAPERVVILARNARDLRSMTDTTLNGVSYARVAGTLDRIPFTLWIDRTSTLPARVDYRAEQPNDFGLAPWGPMQVSHIYSRWTKLRNGIAYPMAIDIARVGRPYKRIQIFNADLSATIHADSFAISDSVRSEFFRTSNKPMQDLPLDSERVLDQNLIQFGTSGAPQGAVRTPAGWMLIEGGTAPMNAERATAWVNDASHGGGARVAGAIITSGAPYGGTAWLAKNNIPLVTAKSAEPYIKLVLNNRGIAVPVGTTLKAQKSYADALIAIPADLPESPGVILLYSPKMKWMYGPFTGPMQLDAALRIAASKGWQVDFYGAPGRLKVAAPKAAN